MAVAGTAGYFAKLGLPVPEIMVWLAIAVELGGGLLLIIGWKTRWMALAAVAVHRHRDVHGAPLLGSRRAPSTRTSSTPS